jgi:hypothetical protein
MLQLDGCIMGEQLAQPVQRDIEGVLRCISWASGHSSCWTAPVSTSAAPSAGLS